MMKRCSKCEAEKPLGEFHREAATHDGRQRWCKACGSEYKRSYNATTREARAEYARRYTQEHAGAVREYKRRYRQENAEAIREYARRHRAENPEAARERDRRYNAANKEAQAEYARRYYRANVEAVAEYNRRYREANKEAQRERMRLWNAENRDKKAEYQQRRRARKLGASSEPYTRAEVFAKTDAECYSCGAEITYERFVADHVTPLQPQEGEARGTDTLDNLMPQCPTCSSRKRNLAPTEALFTDLRARREADDAQALALPEAA